MHLHVIMLSRYAGFKDHTYLFIIQMDSKSIRVSPCQTFYIKKRTLKTVARINLLVAINLYHLKFITCRLKM